MRLIDVHTHAFEKIAGFGWRGELRALGNGRARWANGEEFELLVPGTGTNAFTGDALEGILRSHNVEKAVLLQGSYYGFQNEYAFEVAQKYPDLFIAACTVDPFCADAKGILSRFLNKFRSPVVKFEVSAAYGLMGYHSVFAIDGELLSPLIEMTAEKKNVLALDLGLPGTVSYQPEAVANLAKRYPELKIVVCHLLNPAHDGGVSAFKNAAFKDALRLLRLNNVWFDLAALPLHTQQPYPYEAASKFVRIACDTVGHDKLMWGSDLPSVIARDSYKHLIDYLEVSNLFSANELEAIYYSNARQVYFDSQGIC